MRGKEYPNRLGVYGIGLSWRRWVVRIHIILVVTNSVIKVKEGTENRGAIESVVRLVRKTVCTRHIDFNFC
jgi:hypothetical protein